MLVVAVIAIIFVGPKELPGMLRTFGKAMKKVRALAGDFQRQFNDALEDAELDGLKDTVNKVRDLDPTKQIKDKLNPLKQEMSDISDDLKETTDFDPNKLFDESKAPVVDEPVKVDVEAALERQAAADKAAKSASKKVAAKPAVKKAATAKKAPTKTAVAKKAAPVKKAAPKKAPVKKAVAKAKPKKNTTKAGA